MSESTANQLEQHSSVKSTKKQEKTRIHTPSYEVQKQKKNRLLPRTTLNHLEPPSHSLIKKEVHSKTKGKKEGLDIYIDVYSNAPQKAGFVTQSSFSLLLPSDFFPLHQLNLHGRYVRFSNSLGILSLNHVFLTIGLLYRVATERYRGWLQPKIVNDPQKSVASQDVERLQSAESSLLAVPRVTGEKTMKLTPSATVLEKHQQRRKDCRLLNALDQ